MREERSGPVHDLGTAIGDFLADLAQANRSAHTRRAYATDLSQFATWYQGALTAITPSVLRDFFATVAHLSPATRARKQAAVTSFLAWAYRQELIEANPMGRIERVTPTPPKPRGVGRTQVETILAAIPATQRRDRLLFRLLFETGMRISEALALCVEDIDLTLDDEHLHVVGKGNKRRTVLLDDPKLVNELRTYLKRMGYKHGPIFRALKNEVAPSAINLSTNAGPGTARKPISSVPCTNCVTPTPPS